MSRYNQMSRSWKGVHSMLLSIGRRSLVCLELGYNTQRLDETRVSLEREMVTHEEFPFNVKLGFIFKDVFSQKQF